MPFCRLVTEIALGVPILIHIPSAPHRTWDSFDFLCNEMIAKVLVFSVETIFKGLEHQLPPHNQMKHWCSHIAPVWKDVAKKRSWITPFCSLIKSMSVCCSFDGSPPQDQNGCFMTDNSGWWFRVKMCPVNGWFLRFRDGNFNHKSCSMKAIVV